MPAVARSRKERTVAVGALILERRKALKLTRMALAVDLKCSLATVQFWERGLHLPTQKALTEALAKRLNIDPKELKA